MQLTATTLGELIKSLRSNEMSGPEKRRQPRVGLRARAEIQIPGTGEHVSIWLRDVSAGGISLLSPRYFEAEQQFSLLLGGEDDESTLCCVRHCRRVGSDLFAIGAKFVDYKAPRRSKNR